MDPLLCTSPQCLAFLEKHHIESGNSPTSKSFWEDLEAIFETFGMAWTDDPLIPIMTKLTPVQRVESIRKAAIRKEKEQVANIEHEHLAEVGRQEKIKKQQARIIRRLEQKRLAMKK